MAHKKFLRMILPNLAEVHAYTEGQVKKSVHIFDVKMKMEWIRRPKVDQTKEFVTTDMVELFKGAGAGKKSISDLICGNRIK